MAANPAGFAPSLPALPPRSGRRLAIVGVTAIPMATPDRLADHTVVIDDGVIAAIGPRSQVDTGGADVVDGRGKFLLPGLTDAHVHMPDVADAPLFLAAGVTRVRHMFGRPEHVAYARKVAGGDWAGPRLACASTIVDGLNAGGRPYWAGSIGIDDPDDAAALVARLKAIGYTQLKCYSLLRPATHAALGRACLDHGLPMGGHCPMSLTIEQAIANGQTSFEHFCGLGRGRLGPAGNEVYERAAASGRFPEYDVEVVTQLVESLDWDAVQRLADQMRGQRIWSCPTVVVSDHPIRSPGSFRDADWLGFVPATYRAMWETVAAFWPQHAQLVQLRPRLRDTLLRCVALMHDAGAPLLVGTDCGNPWVAPGGSVATELENFVAAGLSTFDTLRYATVEPARFLGLPEGAGTIGPGQLADLVLLDRDPIASIDAVRSVRAVFVNGWHLDRETLDRLRERAVGGPTAELAASVTSAPPEPAEVRAAGTLVSRTFGSASGSVGYRWCDLPDGRHVLDEVELSRDARIERHLEVAASGHLHAATVRRATAVGAATTTVEVGDGAVTTRTDDHGVVDRTTVPVDGAVVAGAGLAATALLVTGEGSAHGVVLDPVGAHIAPVTVSRDGDDVTATYDHWAVPVNPLLGASATRLSSSDGRVASVVDLMRQLDSERSQA